MASDKKVCVLLFHRDLRIVDHRGLEAAIKTGAPILPLFVFTPEQVSVEKNTLRSLNSVQFMLESLADLSSAIREKGGRMMFAYGQTENVLKSLAHRYDLCAVIETADYTPYALKRTETIKKTLSDLSGVEYIQVADSYLLEPGTATNKSGKTFQKFTPFYEAVRHRHIDEPSGTPSRISWASLRVVGGGKHKTRKVRRAIPQEVTLEAMIGRLVLHPNKEIAIHGGRKEGLKLLAALPRDYAKIHDVPAMQTSMLSAHNHYGTLSIREVYAKGKTLDLTEFVRQLWWRDFYGHIMADFKGLYGVDAYEFQRTPTHEQSAASKKAFQDWCEAKTGVPLVDAGMTQLLCTGYMHNRVRLVVASWLVKDMNVHWRFGERFFA
ncbi:MAG: hypothetical protein EBY22_13385, partial [Gammaproteobacteria bacterium]|nr:hypothetical protein [Gammaproteobacteria bacterium]